ncbi:MAG: D-2-hydroxyacid dehydrogenase [Cyclobacteriaceae bacterium]|nr:D-2-hydroxyacid dehydrogenase [Cyclobacteriaceae bacterium]
MKIVIIDGYTLNPGDLSWGGIEEFGQVTLYDRTPDALVQDRCKDADIILTNKVPISADTIQAATGLKLICVTATGFNIVDVEAARKRNIPVCNIPGYGTASVAQHTFALLLELTNHVGLNSTSVKEGMWEKSPDFCYTKASLTELNEKTFGIIGFGKIGEQVATIAKAFGMNVIYYSIEKKDTALATFVDLKTMFTSSDVISLHCPLTKANNQFVNRDLLNLVKPSLLMINTARGQLINEHDLAEALNTDKLAGAALDVLSKEPPTHSNPLLHAKNCLITPHNAWMSLEARTRMLAITKKNIEGFLANKPVNTVA